jgi:glutamate-1-semialdehyde 2,1-aminomutase
MTETNRSRAIYERALRVLPGGVSRNSVLRRPHPIYVARGEGCNVVDVDGVRRIDFNNNMASLIHGHAHPAVVAAVTEQLRLGTAFAMATEAEVSYAEHMTSRAPSFERIRFVNSGSEAVLCCLKAARAFTGRPKIAKVEGTYHGVYDYAEVSQTASPQTWGSEDHPASVPVCRGTPRGVLDDVVVIPFNDPARALAILEEHAESIACVLVDPLPHRVGMLPAQGDYIDALRAWTTANGALLVFDEVITFRSEYGGAQAWYRARPDLTALGKIIGGGFPVGAIAGRAEVMDVFNPLATKVLFPHSGTFSANPNTMVAGHAAMRLFDRTAVAHVNALGDRARRGIAEAIRNAEIPACVTGGGSLFRVHLKPDAPHDYRSAYPTAAESAAKDALVTYALEHGLLLIETCSGTISTPMAEREIDRLVETLAAGFRAIRPLLESTAAAR